MASKEQELEWIEQPGGWEGDSETQNEKGIESGSSNENDDGEEGFTGFDLFGEKNPELTFPFEIPTSEDKTIKLRLEGFTLDSDETAQSTGVTLWQAAPRLARYLIQVPRLVAQKRVLELGAGLGLCGMVAHHLGANSVVLTDADTITLERMRSNLEKNCNNNSSKRSIGCRQLIWNNTSQMEECGTFDTLLGADVIYTIESLDPLFDTVIYFLQRQAGASFVLSRYTKYGAISDETVLDAARARNLVLERPSEGIFVFRLNGEEET
mmetsp:Transcript_13103/g.33036  ORF Transcript_13103/g.33036 Transcript_13103/m.33036 type:complete len:267 (+) Transcript_13103:253-1053(+)|eukprot:CAMPEP_0116091734 /NCGR_PEP_ID=MMETSP0327-20121206/7663_1 /TAXON_ID=44447 /ORGANISM="Pseudo-nitzschia delicatissima, Strain B596" /LENGTH=266 /DNA_ID=CAMNT_0003583105 /DNA_START=234 /DNA_END=1034 /DNA_ORIENTATION=-